MQQISGVDVEVLHVIVARAAMRPVFAPKRRMPMLSYVE